ncbi:MAG: DNA alkylation repair protein [Prevotellaceae bacterium]|nr:DNA alkylation repair protein [Prevotellaceae bacterium]
MKEETQEKLRQIKSRFRLMMNGVVSQSMREKGLGYKINWGIGLPVLKDMVKEYGKDFSLAIELWKEDIRECRILATMIMPSEEMSADMVNLWISQVGNQEIAEMASFNLFQYVEGAKDYALLWISSDDELKQLCGYSVLSRLFMRGEELSIREINEYFDQAQVALEGESLSVRHSVAVSLSRFCSLGDEYEKLLKSAFKTYDLDVF